METKIRNLIIKTNDQWDQIKESNKMTCINSGVKAIDEIVGGYFVKELTVLSAASGNGKSIIGLTSALRMSDLGYKVLYISLENSLSVDASRRDRIIKEYGIDKDKEKFSYFNSDLGNGLVSCDDIEELVSGETTGYDAVFIDSVDFIKEVMENANEGFSSFRILNEVCDRLRKLAAKERCAIIVTAQLNRGSNGKELCDINMGDIQGSLGIVQKASHVWAIQKNYWGMKLIKNRTELLGNSDFMYMSVDGNTLDVRIQGRGVCTYGKNYKR